MSGFSASGNETGSWTPGLTFVTPGDLSVVLSVAYGNYIRNGRLVTVTFNMVSSTFTHTTASGNLTFTGLPFAANNAANDSWYGTIAFQGITKASYTNFITKPTPNTTTMIMVGSASAQNISIVTAADLPTGTQKTLQGSLTYMTT